MTSKGIRKLKNKIWLTSWGLSSAIMVIILFLVYLSNESFLQQQFQNSLVTQYLFTMESLRRDGEALNDGFFVEVGPDGEILSTSGQLPWELRDLEDVREKALNQIWSGRLRHRFLWRVPAPFIQVDGDHWGFIFLMDGSRRSWPYLEQQGNLDEPAGTAYFLFKNANHTFAEILHLQQVVLNVGIGGFFLLLAVTNLFARKVVRPTEMAIKKQKQFIADVSHELKTPITALKNNLGILAMDEDATIGSVGKWLDNLEYGVERLGNLTRNLLILAQLEAMEVPLDKQFFQGDDVVRMVIASMAGQLEAKNIRFEEDLMALTLHQPREKWIQVVTALLDNAIKYAENGGWVQVGLRQEQKAMVLVVKNSGPGIPAAKLPYVFERFYRVDESRTGHDSYGLGLPIAASIADQLGGKITAASIENKETAFIFSFS